MKKDVRRFRVILALILTTLLLGSAVPAAEASQDVYDYLNWILSYYQRYQQIANQYRQISNQVRQIQQLAKSLESFTDADWSDFDLDDLDALLAYGEHLGYRHRSFVSIFDNTFPGYERPESWPAEFETRVRRTRETLRLINQSLRSLSDDGDSEEDLLADLQARSETADSPLEELETANMYANHSIVQIRKSIQASLLTANTIAVAQAEELQRKASAEAARNGWIDRDPLPPLYPSDDSGHTGVPDGWAYTIF